MSTLRSSERNRYFRIRHAEIILPSPTLIFLVLPSVTNECMVWRFILLLNLVGSSMHSKINLFLSSSPIFYIFDKTSSFFSETDFPIAMLNKHKGLLVPKGFIFALIISSIWPKHILSFLMLCGLKVDVISSFLSCLIRWINLIWLTYAKNKILATTA